MAVHGGRINYQRLTPALANGVRAAVATLIPFFLAASLGRAELSWMALGGWLGTLADPGGLRSARAKAVGTFALLGALVLPLAERCGTSTWLAMAMLAIVAFGGTLARALGPAAATVGTMTAVVAAVGTARNGSTSYGVDALAFVGGALWATILSSMVWPVSMHRPVRKAVAAVFEAMGEYALALATSAETSLERWLAEPLRRAEQGETAMQLVTRARRLANACTTLDVRALHGVDDAAGREGYLRAIETYGQALAQRASNLRP